MTTHRVAVRDDSLGAVVISRRPLHYAAGHDEHEDRPAHVRAGSSMAWVANHIALVQDDANFVAIVDPASADVRAIALPRGDAGMRQFDDARGNKKFKLDLEACVAIDDDDGPIVLAFGSGSKRRRRQVVRVDRLDANEPRVLVADATTFYEQLEANAAFAGSDMNIEGALAFPDVLRFFGRGNGKARGDLRAVNATCDVSLHEFLAYLQDPERIDPPAPKRVVQYDLGALGGVPLGFTDATIVGDDVLYTATAEGSEDASTDGAVSGSVLGVIARDGRVRFTDLRDASGTPYREKVEGLLRSRTSPHHLWIVIDADDATRPSELCEVKLAGAWIADALADPGSQQKS